jgi:hypothetical protein
MHGGRSHLESRMGSHLDQHALDVTASRGGRDAERVGKLGDSRAYLRGDRGVVQPAVAPDR